MDRIYYNLHFSILPLFYIVKMFMFGVFKLKYSTFWLINLFYFVNNALLLVTNANSQHALLFNILVCFYIRQRWILNSFWVWSYGFTIIHTINLWNTLHACSGFTKPCRHCSQTIQMKPFSLASVIFTSVVNGQFVLWRGHWSFVISFRC